MLWRRIGSKLRRVEGFNKVESQEGHLPYVLDAATMDLSIISNS